MVMAVPLALAFAAEALLALRGEWRARRVGWVALGGASGNALVRRAALALLLVVGLLAAQSRGGLAAFAVAVLALPLALRHRRLAAAIVAAVVLSGVAWMGAGGHLRAFEARGVRSNRLALWADAARLVKDFPVFGCGFNAFGSAYVPYQRVDPYEWYGEAHNEYLQALVENGVVGAALAVLLLATLLRRAVRACRLGPLEAGCLASLLGLCAHNLVEFNWQIPANAATWVALAGLAARRGDPEVSGWGDIALTPADRRR
jgi:O-antigen ligase